MFGGLASSRSGLAGVGARYPPELVLLSGRSSDDELWVQGGGGKAVRRG